MARELLAGARKRRGPASAKKAGRQGATKLNDAVSESIQENTAGIAETLLLNAMKGNLTSLRYLFELAQGSQEETAVAKRRLTRSIASELAAEPQWHEELTDGKAQTGIGGREG